VVWEHGVFSSSFSRAWAFFTLKECGRGANWFIFLVNRIELICRGVAPVHYWADGLVCFVYLY